MIENMERGARNIGVEELRAQVDKASFATIDALKSPLGADKRSFYEGLLENLNGARAWMSYNKLRYTSAVVLGITMLTSCAPAIVVVPIPDGEPNRPTITQAAPSATETGTKTATATETPSPESLLPPEMTEKYLSKFEKTEEGTKQINGMDTNIIYGVKADGTKQVIAMNIEINGKMRMTRVGEYTDEAGFSYYTVMGNNMGHRVEVTDETARSVFSDDPDDKTNVNIWRSLGKQFGMSPAEAKDYVMIKNQGKLSFKVSVGNPTANADIPSKFETLPNKVDFDKPVEITTIATWEEYQALAPDLKSRLIIDRNLYLKSGGKIDNQGNLMTEAPLNGWLLWVKPNGQLLLISVGTPIEQWKVLTPEKLSETEKKYVNSYIRDYSSLFLIQALNMVHTNQYTPFNSFGRQSRNFLEIDGFVNSSSR